MSSRVDLTAMVQHAMRDLISIHNLKIITISENEVGLLSQSYVIKLFTDREGINIVYFDKASLSGYNLVLFIIHKRRDLLEFSKEKLNYTSRSDYLEHVLIILTQHLDNAGQDILRGCKAWINEYLWPTVQPDQAISKLLLV